MAAILSESVLRGPKWPKAKNNKPDLLFLAFLRKIRKIRIFKSCRTPKVLENRAWPRALPPARKALEFWDKFRSNFRREFRKLRFNFASSGCRKRRSAKRVRSHFYCFRDSFGLTWSLFLMLLSQFSSFFLPNSFCQTRFAAG